MDTILSNEECVEILKQVNDNVELEHFEVVTASDDILGFLGEYFKLEIYTKDVCFLYVPTTILFFNNLSFTEPTFSIFFEVDAFKK